MPLLLEEKIPGGGDDCLRSVEDLHKIFVRSQGMVLTIRQGGGPCEREKTFYLNPFDLM